MIQIAICEDLELDFIETKALIDYYMKKHGLKYHIDGFKTGEALLETFYPCRYSLIILDMILPGINGMEAARILHDQDRDCRLIITTISEEYAIEGYRVQAVDYLLKPFSYKQICDALNRCGLGSVQDTPSISIIVNQTVTTLPVLDVRIAEIFGNYLLIHTGDAVIKTYLSLSAFETQLPPFTFVRISRSHLVNMHDIVEITGETALLSDGQELSISRRRKRMVKQSFNDFLIAKARRLPCE